MYLLIAVNRVVQTCLQLVRLIAMLKSGFGKTGSISYIKLVQRNQPNTRYFNTLSLLTFMEKNL